MKVLLLAMLLPCALLFSGCGDVPLETAIPTGTVSVSPTAELPSLAQDEEPSYLTATIVDGAETGKLLLAGEAGYDVYTIGVQDIMSAVNAVKGATYKMGEALIIATVLYFCLTFPTSKIIAHFERKMSRGDKR